MMLSMVEMDAAPGPLGMLSCEVYVWLGGDWVVLVLQMMLSVGYWKRGYDVSGWVV